MHITVEPADVGTHVNCHHLGASVLPVEQKNSKRGYRPTAVLDPATSEDPVLMPMNPSPGPGNLLLVPPIEVLPGRVSLVQVMLSPWSTKRGLYVAIMLLSFQTKIGGCL